MKRSTNMSSLLAEIFKVREGIKRKAGETHVKVTWWLWGFCFVCRETVRVSARAAVQSNATAEGKMPLMVL